MVLFRKESSGLNVTRGAGSGTVCKVALINTNTMIPCSRILSRKLTFQKSSQSYHESLEQHFFLVPRLNWPKGRSDTGNKNDH